jgi:hypothetical protein
MLFRWWIIDSIRRAGEASAQRHREEGQAVAPGVSQVRKSFFSRRAMATIPEAPHRMANETMYTGKPTALPERIDRCDEDRTRRARCISGDPVGDAPKTDGTPLKMARRPPAWFGQAPQCVSLPTGLAMRLPQPCQAPDDEAGPRAHKMWESGHCSPSHSQTSSPGWEGGVQRTASSCGPETGGGRGKSTMSATKAIPKSKDSSPEGRI